MVNDDPAQKPPARSWLEKLSHFLHPEPQNRKELLSVLEEAVAHDLIDMNALTMIEGVIEVSEMQVRDIMVPRSQMVVIEQDAAPATFMQSIKQSGHSRFPVIGDTRDEIIGILLAKDLIQLYFETTQTTFDIQSFLRPAYFVPESKRLDVLLRDFRQNCNHMAIVLDEYGGVSGLVTIEDILEEIVGDITDEHDISAEEHIKKIDEKTYLIKPLTPIEVFNDYFGTALSDEDFDTIGGLVTQTLGHMPKKGETVRINPLEFRILHADGRRIRLMELRLDPT